MGEQQGGDFCVAALGGEHQRRVVLKIGFGGVEVCAFVEQQTEKGKVVHLYRMDNGGLGAVERAGIRVGSGIEQQGGDGKFVGGGDIVVAIVAVGEACFQRGFP